MLHVEGNFTISPLRKYPSIANVILLFLYFLCSRTSIEWFTTWKYRKGAEKQSICLYFDLEEMFTLEQKQYKCCKYWTFCILPCDRYFFIIKMGICKIYFKTDFIRFKTFGLKSYWIFWMYIIYFRCLLQTYWSIFGTSSKILMPNEPYHANQCSEYDSI